MSLQRQIISILADGPMNYTEILQRGREKSDDFYGEDMLREIFDLIDKKLIFKAQRAPFDPIYQLTMPFDKIEKLLLL